MSNTYNILLVDDDKDIVEFIEYNLKKEGYTVKSCYNANDALKIVKTFHPHLLLLDVMMPGMDGIELCEQLRRNESLNQSVIAFLTARGEDYSQIAGFDAGADDYITKPIKPKLLMSRIKALLKRFSHVESASQNAEMIQIDNIIIDKSSYTITLDGVVRNLPKKEFELLFLLASAPGKVFYRTEIYDQVWGTDVIVGDRTIDVHIRKLREVIGNDKVVTIKGVGYKYKDETL